MPDADIEVAVAVAERVRGLVADQGFAVSGAADKLPVTISIGVATTRDPTATTEALLGRADEALYQATGRGRHCVAAVEGDMPRNRNSTGTLNRIPGVGGNAGGDRHGGGLTG